MKKYCYFLLFILLASCSKDDDKLTQTCEDFPESQSVIGYKIINKPNATYAPSFNPNNTQEFCFGRNVHTPDGNYNIDLWKVNLVNWRQQKLGDAFWGEPDWGKNGWILFNRPGNQIYKIKSNGDSLTHLPFPDVCFNPRWNNATGSLLHNISDHPTSSAVERSADGQNVQYVQSRKLHYFIISPDGSKLVSAPSGSPYSTFYLFNYPSLNEMVLGEMDGTKGEAVGFKAWHPDNLHVFWTCRKGLFKTNVATKQTWQLKTGCDSRSYQAIDISPDGKTIAVTRHDVKLIEENMLEAEISIYLMDINGNNERKLAL